MGRWTQHDEDDFRLPEGMKRVGYDADTGRHYFRDSDGSLWEGPEGAGYGEMTKVTNAPAPSGVESNSNVDVEAAGLSRSRSPPGAQTPQYTPASPYRTLFPFLLIIATSLLLVWRVFLSPSPPFPSSNPPPTLKPSCTAPDGPYEVRLGDSCWKIAQARSSSVDSLKAANPGLVCSELQPGQRICVPASNQKRIH